MPYIHFTEEQKRLAASVDLVEFLRQRGEKLLPSGHEKRLDSDHSITVRGNEWYDHAAEKGGGPISFAQTFYHLSYPDAVTLLLGGSAAGACLPEEKQAEVERKQFELPPANHTMRRVYAYLLKKRHIQRDVLNAFVHAGLIYEDEKYHNAVFVGKDEHGVARHAHKRSTHDTGKTFRINVEGSDPRCSFHWTGVSDRLYVFEGPIDRLSYSAGRVIHQYAADFGTFEFTYDFDSRHNVCTGADGYINEIWFDEQGRITKRRDSSGEEEVTYNNLNQITSRTDREGNTTSYEYDEDGNISCTTYPDGTTEEFEYDENRMPIWIKDRNGNDSSYTYDAQGYVTSFTDGRGNTVRYDYDDDKNLVSYADALGNVTEYTYDGKGNRLTKTDANGNTTKYTYDEQGRLISSTDADGQVTSYEYTEAGKLLY